MVTFVLGLLLAIPLSVVGNLATARWERWWQSRQGRRFDSQRAKDRRLREIGRTFEQIPERFALYVLMDTRFLISQATFAVIGAAGVSTAVTGLLLTDGVWDWFCVVGIMLSGLLMVASVKRLVDGLGDVLTAQEGYSEAQMARLKAGVAGEDGDPGRSS